MIRPPPRSTLFPLHDALPISDALAAMYHHALPRLKKLRDGAGEIQRLPPRWRNIPVGYGEGEERNAVGLTQSLRSEEHTSELQSRQYLVCRLLLVKNTVIAML